MLFFLKKQMDRRQEDEGEESDEDEDDMKTGEAKDPENQVGFAAYLFCYLLCVGYINRSFNFAA